MAKVCEVCGKGPIVVNSVIRRHAQVYLDAAEFGW